MPLSIGDLAQAGGVTPSAIRYYEQAGLIPAPGRKSGRRAYDTDALDQLEMIGRARSAGFAIREIRELTDLMRGDALPDDYCEDAKALARLKIAELDKQIAQARTLRAELEEALKADCSGQQKCTVLGR
jgi:DNA-binding transcriptional MerR regulator